MRKLTNREIVELLYHYVIVLDPRIDLVELEDGTLLRLKKGELYLLCQKEELLDISE